MRQRLMFAIMPSGSNRDKSRIVYRREIDKKVFEWTQQTSGFSGNGIRLGLETIPEFARRMKEKGGRTILMVLYEDTCIYSALNAAHPLDWEDVALFFEDNNIPGEFRMAD